MDFDVISIFIIKQILHIILCKCYVNHKILPRVWRYIETRWSQEGEESAISVKQTDRWSDTANKAKPQLLNTSGENEAPT
jgi:hypothetical protein